LALLAGSPSGGGDRIFEALFRASPVGILISSPEGLIMDANEAATRVLGFARDELRGRSSAELAILPGEVREQLLRSVRRDGVVKDQEVRITTRSGARRDVVVSVHRAEMAGETVLVTTFLDVTARTRDEQKFRGLLESAPDAMLIVDDDGRISLVNGQAERLFGYTRDELIGEPIEKLVPERHRGQHLEHRRRFSAGPSLRPMGAALELFGERKNGDQFPAEVSLSPIATEDGAVVVAAVRDTTDRKEMQARIALSDRLASMGTLAAGIAHEINNPLAFVMSNLELVDEELRDIAGSSPSERLRHMLELIAEARTGAERVRKIVRGLKIFNRADEERRESLDLSRALDVAVNMASNELRHRARLVKDYGETPPLVADESRLVQVFINLLMNAAHAIPEGHFTSNEIRLVTRAAGDQVLVEVRDTGAGIAPDAQARIFDPFFTTKPVGVGTGLGLTICHGIVRSMGGQISVESEPGVGTTVRLTLPVGSLEPAPDRPASAAPRTGRRGRVLIIDDDPMVATSLQRILRDHQSTLVATGAAAVALLRAGKTFDAIVCDLMMPEMTGMDLHATLGQSQPEMCDRIVFVTGGAFTVAARTFLDAVPNRVLEKPCDPDTLRAVIQTVIR
jgi:two-component system cell cycle sensor histidine kinase/response regulator CckA